MAKVKVRLLHSSSVKGSEGAPGDIVTADQGQVEVWLASRGCELLEGTRRDTAPTESAPTPETGNGDAEPAGNSSDADGTPADSSEATAKPAARKRKKAATKK